MTAPTLTRDAKITDLFLMGNPIETIAATGASRGHWTRADCLRVASENQWTLDATGRVPRDQRRRPPAAGPAPVPRPAPDPGSGRAQVAAMLGQPAPARAPQPDPAAQLIADGRAHTVARVRKLADKADDTLAQLRRALAHEAGREQLRRRLAELDAEREQLRAQLAGPGRPTKTTTPAQPAPKPPADGGDKPINHGTWGGYLVHRNRGEVPCETCDAAREQTMADRAAKRSA